MRRFVMVATVFSLALAITAVAFAGGDCSCTDAKAEGGWCNGCSAGFYGDMVLTSKKLHGALQGHKIPAEKVAYIDCEGCKTALAKNGACEPCNVSFVNKHAFHSRYAAALAHGERMQWDEKKYAEKKAKGEVAECQGCETAARTGGWCKECSVGFVGSYLYKDKVQHKTARKALTMIQRADKISKSCESCAVAMVTDSKCDSCNLAFKNGKKIRL